MYKYLVSYVIPSHNHQNYILDCLNSIRSDGDFIDGNYEIVIIDDGSTDTSVKLILDWQRENPEVNLNLLSRSNNGISKTLNELFSLVQGEYIRPCSSDDLIAVGSSKQLIDGFKTKTLCVFGDCILIDDYGRVIGSSSIEYHGGNKRRLLNQGHINIELIRNWCVSGPSLMLKRSFIDEFRYDENSRIDDFDLFLTLIRKGEVVYIDEDICFYRIHGSNISKSKSVSIRISNLSSFLMLINKHMSLFKDKKVLLALDSLRFKTIAKIFYLKRMYFLSMLYYSLYVFKRII